MCITILIIASIMHLEVKIRSTHHMRRGCMVFLGGHPQTRASHHSIVIGRKCVAIYEQFTGKFQCIHITYSFNFDRQIFVLLTSSELGIVHIKVFQAILMNNVAVVKNLYKKMVSG